MDDLPTYLHACLGRAGMAPSSPTADAGPSSICSTRLMSCAYMSYARTAQRGSPEWHHILTASALSYSAHRVRRQADAGDAD